MPPSPAAHHGGVSDTHSAGVGPPDEDHGDQLPADLDVTGYVGPYTFPDVRRRRYPAVLYVIGGLALVALYLARGDAVLVNAGFLWGGVALVLIGGYSWSAAYPLAVDATEALAAAGRAANFTVGHASAQLGWRGLRSRPTWRILLYSAEEPPARRGFVLVDAVDAEIVGQHVEENPEDWSQYGVLS